MKRRVLLALVFSFGACKPKVTPEIAPADAGMQPPPTASIAPKELTPPPRPRSQELELVAVGKNETSRIVWLKKIGERVWLSGNGLDAYADGDGPLVPAPDLLKGIAYEPKNHRLQVVGAYPRLFALRTKIVEVRGHSEEPTAFVFQNPGWKEAKPFERQDAPWSFVPWGDGALLVWSQNMGNAHASYSPDHPGTTFAAVGPDGSVSDAKLPIDRSFMAWSADSDGTYISILGAKGIPDAVSKTVLVVRGTKDTLHTTELFTGPTVGMHAFRTSVRETGAAAVVAPNVDYMANETFMWKTGPTKVHVVSEGQARPQAMTASFSCRIIDADLRGTTLYGQKECLEQKENALMKSEAGAKAESIKLPALVAKDAGGFRKAKTGEAKALTCRAESFVLRGKDDLWIVASCGDDDVRAVFRMGLAQEPIVLP
jgi:hypothetical protein